MFILRTFLHIIYLVLYWCLIVKTWVLGLSLTNLYLILFNRRKTTVFILLKWIANLNWGRYIRTEPIRVSEQRYSRVRETEVLSQSVVSHVFQLIEAVHFSIFCLDCRVIVLRKSKFTHTWDAQSNTAA